MARLLSRRRLLAMLCSRQTLRRLLILLLLPGAVLVYVSFSASRALVSSVPLSRSAPDRPVIQQHQDFLGGRKIILMTYGRSGSSFTSDIIQRHPDVFYTFEPLFNLIRRHATSREGRRNVMYRNMSQESYDKESIAILEVFLSCSFETMNVEDINNYQLRNSRDSRLLWQCSQRRLNSTPLQTVDCFLQARKICVSRPVKMVKTIRLRGAAAAEMMVRHKDLQLLYLVRDPRGTITSQRRVFRSFSPNEMENFTVNYCRVFREDLGDLEPLFDQFPDRVKLLRYEALAENPMKVSAELYSFLGLNFTRDVREFVFNITSAGLSSRNAYGTVKPNSTSAAYKWRKLITLREAQLVDKICADIYSKLGYLPVISEHDLFTSNRTLKTEAIFHGKPI